MRNQIECIDDFNQVQNGLFEFPFSLVNRHHLG